MEENTIDSIISLPEDHTDPNTCFICGKEGFKSDGKSRMWCESCLNEATTITQTEGWSKHKIEAKQGRNEVCDCGSGRKYKKCCLVGLETEQTNRMIQAWKQVEESQRLKKSKNQQ